MTDYQSQSCISKLHEARLCLIFNEHKLKPDHQEHVIVHKPYWALEPASTFAPKVYKPASILHIKLLGQKTYLLHTF